MVEYSPGTEMTHTVGEVVAGTAVTVAAVAAVVVAATAPVATAAMVAGAATAAVVDRVRTVGRGAPTPRPPDETDETTSGTEPAVAD